jgi:hypothetical protein
MHALSRNVRSGAGGWCRSDLFWSSTDSVISGLLTAASIIVTGWLHSLNRPLLEKQSERRAQRKDLPVRTSSVELYITSFLSWNSRLPNYFSVKRDVMPHSTSQSLKLLSKNLSQIASQAGRATVRVPTYDRSSVKEGVVHIGVGGFHRAHLAVYLHNLMEKHGVFSLSTPRCATS